MTQLCFVQAWAKAAVCIECLVNVFESCSRHAASHVLCAGTITTIELCQTVVLHLRDKSSTMIGFTRCTNAFVPADKHLPLSSCTRLLMGENPCDCPMLEFSLNLDDSNCEQLASTPTTLVADVLAITTTSFWSA
jgi:hypothetical protein